VTRDDVFAVMARSPALTALLSKYGIVPCDTDGACMFFPDGARAAACTCIDVDRHGLRKLARGLTAIIRELDQQPEQIAAVRTWAADAVVTANGRADVAERKLAAILDAPTLDVALAAVNDMRAGRWKEQG
jgi:hypothetical protein